MLLLWVESLAMKAILFLLTVSIMATIIVGSTTTEYVMIPVGNNISLNVAHTPGPGPALVLLHGFPEGSVVWEPVVELLTTNMSQSGLAFDIYAPDLRGYNRSSIPTSPLAYEMPLLIGDIQQLILTVSPRSPVLLVGHDWGGSIAYALAHAWPELLAGLVIIDAPQQDAITSLLETDPQQDKMVSFWLPLMYLPDETSMYFQKNHFTPLLESFPSSFTPYYKTQLQAGYSEPGSSDAMCYYYSANAPPHKTIPTPQTVITETCILWGNNDPYLLAEPNIELAKKWVNVYNSTIIPGGTHYPHMQVPAQVASTITSFAHHLLENGKLLRTT